MAEPAHRRPPALFQSMVLDPVRAFSRLEAAGGIVLLVNALAAFVLANSPWKEPFLDLWETPVRVELGGLGFQATLKRVIDDGLMATFFLVVGMEIKRELIEGELRTFRRALLPGIGAAGGVLLPALIYAAFNRGGRGADGWAIPMATDIAFSVGCLVVLGHRVSRGLLVFLTALAIFDDIAGIAVIALFYGHGVNMAALVWVALAALAVFAAARLGVENALVYAAGGLAMWVAFHHAGLHGTLAGVLLGLLVPGVSRRPVGDAVRDAIPPLQRFEHALHPWVVFGVLPLFALANSGVSLEGISHRSLTGPVFLGIALGLFLGKQLGIFLFTYAAVKGRLAVVPGGAPWGKVYGVATVAGIGFTVSLFIADLAFGSEPALLDEARLGVLVGSLVSGVVGTVVLWAMPSRAPRRVSTSAEVSNTS
jgi:Na+:H+ antiporter, NhaA family